MIKLACEHSDCSAPCLFRNLCKKEKCQWFFLQQIYKSLRNNNLGQPLVPYQTLSAPPPFFVNFRAGSCSAFLTAVKGRLRSLDSFRKPLPSLHKIFISKEVLQVTDTSRNRRSIPRCFLSYRQLLRTFQKSCFPTMIYFTCYTRPRRLKNN